MLLGFVLVIYLTYILRAPIVTFGVLCAAVSMYLMLGLGWAMAYVLIANLNPTAFASSDHSTGPNTMNGFNAFYFSFVTLSTVGYGDIVPVSRTAPTFGGPGSHDRHAVCRDAHRAAGFNARRTPIGTVNARVRPFGNAMVEDN